MADKPKDKKPSGGGLKNDADVLASIFALIVGMILLTGIIASIERRFGSFDSFSFENLPGVFSDTLTDGTPRGTLVETRTEASVWATAARERLLGIQKSGALGRIIDGPLFRDGVSWWSIDFEQEPDGWVAEDEVRILGGLFARIKRVYVPIAWTVSILAFLGLLYFAYRGGKVTGEHRAQMKILAEKISGSGVPEKNMRWEHVTELIASENPGDWRVAIMEADIMLDALLASMGHEGESVGERLKRVEKSDFQSLDAAWEAHKVRNRVAHHGSDFILTHREAKRIIDLYRQALAEFDVI